MKCPQHGQMNGTKEMRKYLQTFSGSKAAISATVGNTITTTTRQARAGNSIGRSTQTLFSCELIMTSAAMGWSLWRIHRNVACCWHCLPRGSAAMQKPTS